MANQAFKWEKDKYTVHVDQVDHEHEHLIGIMNRLHEQNEMKETTKAQLLKTLDDLGKYTKEHFDREEIFFSKIPNYKSVQSHKAIHAKLLADFTAHVEKFKKNGERVPSEFFLFLKVWLAAHICGIDRKYGELVSGKAAS